MTGNKAHLADYQEFKGGSVAFGGSNGRITSKGKIKAGSLLLQRIKLTTLQSSKAKNGDEKLNEDTDSKTNEESVDKEDRAFLEELERLQRQENEANDAAETLRKTFAQRDKIEKSTDFKTCEKPEGSYSSIQNASTSSTNQFNTASTPISTASPLRVFNDGELSYPNDPSMPHLEDIYASLSERIFTDSSYDDEGVEHRQEERIDYDEVFAPVARIEAIRIFLAFASYIRFIVYQIDVKSAFLYGTIDEEVYVSQPPSFVDPKFPNMVYDSASFHPF
nr:copia protein [Tanacetum cinerariifolium]